MIIVLYVLSLVWTIVGILLVSGAWNENKTDYQQITGKVSQVELSYDQDDVYPEQRVVMSTIYLEDDPREYRLRGKLYHLNKAGMESIQTGETLHLMIKKTSIVGGFEIKRSSKSAPVSGIYRPSGETIISLGKGIAHAKQRLLIGFSFILAGVFLGLWAYFKQL